MKLMLPFVSIGKVENTTFLFIFIVSWYSCFAHTQKSFLDVGYGERFTNIRENGKKCIGTDSLFELGGISCIMG